MIIAPSTTTIVGDSIGAAMMMAMPSSTATVSSAPMA